MGRSDSESFSDELANTVKQNDQKSSTELIKKSELTSEKKDNTNDENTNTGGFISFIQLLQSMSGGAIQISSTNDDTDDIQNFLSRLGIVTRKFISFF